MLDTYHHTRHEQGSPTFYKTGELQLARTPDELRGLQAVLERSLAIDVDGIEAANLVSPFEAALLHPLINPDSIVGGLYWAPSETLAPGRVCVDAATEALATRAIKYGAHFLGDTCVAAILREGDRVIGVRLESGKVIRAKAVVFAGYEGIQDVEGVAELGLPIATMLRTWHLSEEIDELGACSSSSKYGGRVQDEVSYRPVVYDPSLTTTVVQLGSRECVCSVDTLSAREVESRLSTLSAARHVEVLPALKEWSTLEPITERVMVTPDGMPLVGPFPALQGLWVAEAVEPDYAFGVGRMLASWINTGNPRVDTKLLDARRFARMGSGAEWRDNVVENAIYAYSMWKGSHDDIDLANPKLMTAAYGVNEFIASFSYDIPEVRTATNALWTAIATRCVAQGVEAPRELNRGLNSIHALASGESLLFAQACPLSLCKNFPGKTQAIAIPKYSAPGCRGFRQRTAIVVNKHRADEFSMPSDFKGAKAAIVSSDSLYSWNMLGSYIGGQGLSELGEIVLVDSYERALAAVRNLEVDVAAIDCVMFELLHRYRMPAVAELSVVGFGPMAPSMPFVTSSSTSKAVIKKLKKILKDVENDRSIRWAFDAIMLDSFTMDVGLQSLAKDISSVECAMAPVISKPTSLILSRPRDSYSNKNMGRPLLIQACLAKDSSFLSGVFADLQEAVVVAKGSKLSLWTATSIAVSGLGMAMNLPSTIVKVVATAVVAESLGRIENDGSDGRFVNALSGRDRKIILSKSIESLRWISNRAFSFVVVSMSIVARNLELFDPLKDDSKCLARSTTLMGTTIVQVGVFRYSDEALASVERINVDAGASMKPCLIYAGIAQPSGEADLDIIRGVVWTSFARKGIDTKLFE